MASGSNGNSVLVESKQTSILVDAGKSMRELEKRMNLLGKSLESVNALLVTHEHIDHTAGVNIIARRYDLPVYVTRRTNMHCNFSRAKEIKHFSHASHFNINDIKINPLKTSHDAIDSSGFVFEANNKRLGFITDSGKATEQIHDALKKLDALYIESNYDPEMLISGPYPHYLKQRILCEQGHFSNIYASQLINEHCDKDVKTIILGHLSGTNNTMDVAENTFKTIAKKFTKTNLVVSSREKLTGSYDV